MNTWESEPNERRWETQAGLVAKICRTKMGHLCGYVGVPNGHPLFGIGYNKPSSALEAALERRTAQPIGPNPPFSMLLALLGGSLAPTPDVVLRVHGGITWADNQPGGETEKPDGRWWFGFDCAHCDDLSPGMPKYGSERGTYRDFPYVESECEALAKQLADIAAEVSP